MPPARGHPPWETWVLILFLCGVVVTPFVLRNFSLAQMIGDRVEDPGEMDPMAERSLRQLAEDPVFTEPLAASRSVGPVKVNVDCQHSTTATITFRGERDALSTEAAYRTRFQSNGWTQVSADHPTASGAFSRGPGSSIVVTIDVTDVLGGKGGSQTLLTGTVNPDGCNR